MEPDREEAIDELLDVPDVFRRNRRHVKNHVYITEQLANRILAALSKLKVEA